MQATGDVAQDADLSLEDLNLAKLKEARFKSGLSLDFWVDLTEGLDQRSFDILVGRSSIFPKYINSKGNP